MREIQRIVARHVPIPSQPATYGYEMNAGSTTWRSWHVWNAGYCKARPDAEELQINEQARLAWLNC